MCYFSGRRPAAFFPSHGRLSPWPGPRLGGGPLEPRGGGRSPLGEGYKVGGFVFVLTGCFPGFIPLFYRRFLFPGKAVVKIGCLHYSRPSLGGP